MKTAVVCHSGGLDSTVLLYSLIDQGYDVRALSVDYGQRHGRELEAAEAVCRAACVEHRLLDLIDLKDVLLGSSLTDTTVPVPHGHYEAESMKATVVPNRNMVLLSLATAWAVSLKADEVAYAAHAGDHAIYPDCRPEFMDAMGVAMLLCDWHKVVLSSPFRRKTKADIVRYGYDLFVPFGLTYSCYEGGAKHCGKCGTCVERREAFTRAGVTDPTVYQE